MSRIAATFAALKKQNRKALIPFVTAGDPDPAMTVPLMHALAAAGADVIELGVPFSDPMADGPTIQRSSERALKHGTSLKHVLGFVAEFRQTDNQTPVVLMGYANPIEAMGPAAFAERYFTEYFARQTTPSAVWQTSVFKIINRNMTWMWGAIFAA